MFDVFLINAIAYIATSSIAFWYFRRLNLYILVWIAYSIIAIFGYICVNMNLHYSHDINLGYHVSVIPYICCYITTFLLTWPLIKFDERKIKMNILDLNIFDKLVAISVLLFTFYSSVNAVRAYIISSTIGFGEAYMMAHAGETNTFFGFSPLFFSIFGWIGNICNAIQPIYVLYFVNRIIKHRGSLPLNLLYCSLAFMPMLFSSLMMGGKAGIFFIVIDVSFFFMIYKNRTSIKVKFKYYVLGFIALYFLSSLVSVVTQSRLDEMNNDKTVLETSISYLGESFPNVGWNLFGKVKNHPNGERFFPEIGGYFGTKTKLSQDDDFDMWGLKTGVDIYIFKTFWGDCYVEFGMLGSFVYISILFLVMYTFFLRKPNRMSIFPVLFFYYHYILIWGLFTADGFIGFGKHRMFIFMIIIGFLIYYFIEKRNVNLILIKRKNKIVR